MLRTVGRGFDSRRLQYLAEGALRAATDVPVRPRHALQPPVSASGHPLPIIGGSEVKPTSQIIGRNNRNFSLRQSEWHKRDSGFVLVCASAHFNCVRKHATHQAFEEPKATRILPPSPQKRHGGRTPSTRTSMSESRRATPSVDAVSNW